MNEAPFVLWGDNFSSLAWVSVRLLFVVLLALAKLVVTASKMLAVEITVSAVVHACGDFVAAVVLIA